MEGGFTFPKTYVYNGVETLKIDGIIDHVGSGDDTSSGQIVLEGNWETGLYGEQGSGVYRGLVLDGVNQYIAEFAE